MKEVVDPVCKSLSERVIWIDVHYFAVPRKIRGQWETPGAQKKGIRHTLSIGLSFDSSVILWSPRRDLYTDASCPPYYTAGYSSRV